MSGYLELEGKRAPVTGSTKAVGAAVVSARDDARHSMASDAVAPNVSNAIRTKERCITPGGLTPR
jgi:hypothetical protein